MILVEFSITPIGKGDSVSSYVARVLDIVDRSGVPYRLGPMGTVLEGEWDEVFGLIKRCQQALNRDCSRISIAIKADCRRGGKSRLDAKVARVERRLGRKLKT
jgi:uncharacterized protein (TIGR00106 family)